MVCEFVETLTDCRLDLLLYMSSLTQSNRLHFPLRVNVAAFLSQSMAESIKYDTCKFDQG